MTYNVDRVIKGLITEADLSSLARKFQADVGLADDGEIGPQTLAALRGHASVPELPPMVWPLAKLPDGRAPIITSGHFLSNPDRPDHAGDDIMFDYDPRSDAPMHIGDAGRTLKFWVPQGVYALAVAEGEVLMASRISTGYRVWVQHVNGLCSGYFHLINTVVQPGDIVHPGDHLGLVGDNPVDDDPRHLHFELYVGDLATYPQGTLDPEPILSHATLT